MRFFSDGNLPDDGGFPPDGAIPPADQDTTAQVHVAATYGDIPPPQQAGVSNLLGMHQFAHTFPHFYNSGCKGPFGTYEDIAGHADTIINRKLMPPSYIRIPLCVVNDGVAAKLDLPSKRSKEMTLGPCSGARVRFLLSLAVLTSFQDWSRDRARLVCAAILGWGTLPPMCLMTVWQTHFESESCAD